MSYPRGNPYGIVYEPWHWSFAAGRGQSGDCPARQNGGDRITAPWTVAASAHQSCERFAAVFAATVVSAIRHRYRLA